MFPCNIYHLFPPVLASGTWTNLHAGDQLLARLVASSESKLFIEWLNYQHRVHRLLPSWLAKGHVLIVTDYSFMNRLFPDQSIINEPTRASLTRASRVNEYPAQPSIPIPPSYDRHQHLPGIITPWDRLHQQRIECQHRVEAALSGSPPVIDWPHVLSALSTENAWNTSGSKRGID